MKSELSTTVKRCTQHREVSLQGSEGLSRLPADENTSPKGVYRVYKNYPPSRVGAPLAVPLWQLEGTHVDEQTQQAIEDWHYWVNQGYQL